MNKDAIVNNMYKTYDYDKFKLMDTNRDIDNINVLRLEREMRKRQYATPIIVNEKFEVVDGQHRLEVCKRNKLPVYYIIVNGLVDEDCRVLNQNQKEWATNDYLQFFAKMGSAAAARLLDLANRYGVSSRLIMSAAGHDTDAINAIKRGDSEYDWMNDDLFTENDYDTAKKRMDQATTIADILSESHARINRAHVLRGVVKCTKSDGFDFERLKTACQEMGSQYSWRIPSRNVVENFCKIYNFRYRKDYMDVVAQNTGFKVTYGNNENRWRY